MMVDDLLLCFITSKYKVMELVLQWSIFIGIFKPCPSNEVRMKLRRDLTIQKALTLFIRYKTL